MSVRFELFVAAAFTLVTTVRAEDSEGEAVDHAAVRAAAERGLALVTAAAQRYPDHRKCFSCHHQTLPLFAARVAADAGLEVDEEFEPAVLEFTGKFFDGKRKNLAAGKHVGGRSATAAYGLWAYEATEAEASETTAALVEYLLQHQGEDGTWYPPSKGRPPLAESPIALAVLAVVGFDKFGTEDRAERIDAARERVRKLLATYEATTNEDFVFRLWGRWALEDAEPDVAAARQSLLDRQRDDGGFAQTDELESDAYSTGQALYVLRYTGTPADHPAVLRAVTFLLETQLEDGSWHVKTRAKPIQVYFDNGDPHGRDQFISTPGTAWAVAGLSMTLERPMGSDETP